MNEPQQISDEKGSILDRVLSSQHAAAIERFAPSDTFSELGKPLAEKELDIVRRRFGLHGQPSETLEEIGARYSVTRERIRQIENMAVQKIKSAKDYRNQISSIERLLMSILSSHGGIMEEELFFQETLSTVGNSADEQRALLFILTELLDQQLEKHLADGVFRTSWKLRAQSLEIVMAAINELVGLITKKGSPLGQDELIGLFHDLPFTHDHDTWFTDQTIYSYLALAAQIGKNPYGEYGLTSWGAIAPKRMNDKIFLVLKKHGQPLHFTKIAEKINDAGFDHRKAYPPTVHNELILNKEYVLVGRGIYALKEWGYQPGVVAEVIIDVLKKSGAPVSREALVRAVLEQRLVKRNTILLALTNKKRFTRLPSGDYILAAGGQAPTQP